MNIFDRLGEVIQATVAANGGKPPKITPLPRPVSALERLRHQRVQAKHYNVADRLLGRSSGTSAKLAKSPAAHQPQRTGPRGPSSGVLLKAAGSDD